MNNIEKLIENGGWRSIEEAPKDGVFFVLFNGTYDIARNAEPENGISKRWFWLAINGSVPVDEISHFMPLDTPERMAKVIKVLIEAIYDAMNDEWMASVTKYDSHFKGMIDCHNSQKDSFIEYINRANKIAGGESEQH